MEEHHYWIPACRIERRREDQHTVGVEAVRFVPFDDLCPTHVQRSDFSVEVGQAHEPRLWRWQIVELRRARGGTSDEGNGARLRDRDLQPIETLRTDIVQFEPPSRSVERLKPETVSPTVAATDEN